MRARRQPMNTVELNQYNYQNYNEKKFLIENGTMNRSFALGATVSCPFQISNEQRNERFCILFATRLFNVHFMAALTMQLFLCSKIQKGNNFN